ncbi:MAG: response regulator [Candidatus Paceibacterota bacterium]
MEEDKNPKKYTVVLVDDDKFLLNMYSMKFSKEGVGITAFQSSEEALEKFRQGLHPDVVLLDVVMPGMDGLELLKILRDEKLIDNSAVILLSNQGAQSDIDKAKVFRIDGYIVKATTIPSEVLREVSRIVEEKRANNL